MAKVKYNKLVRDNIPEIIKKAGKECKIKNVSNDEAIEYLFEKASEELKELKEAKSIEEMADVFEVIYALANKLGFDIEDVLRVKENKAQNNGSFEKNIILLEVNDK